MKLIVEGYQRDSRCTRRTRVGHARERPVSDSTEVTLVQVMALGFEQPFSLENSTRRDDEVRGVKDAVALDGFVPVTHDLHAMVDRFWG